MQYNRGLKILLTLQLVPVEVQYLEEVRYLLKLRFPVITSEK